MILPNSSDAGQPERNSQALWLSSRKMKKPRNHTYGEELTTLNVEQLTSGSFVLDLENIHARPHKIIRKTLFL